MSLLQLILVAKSLFETKINLKRKVIINYVTTIAIVITLISGITDLFFGVFEANWFRLGVILFYFLVLYINRKSTVTAGVLFVISTILIVSVYSCFTGEPTKTHLYLFTIIVGTPFVVDPRNKKLFFILLSMPLFAYIGIKWADYNLWNIKINTGNPEVVSTINMIINFFMMQFFVFLTIRTFLSSENYLLESEKNLRHKNKELIKVNKELDRFVYSVSHDLRAPIASVLGLISLSKDENDVKTLKEYNLLKQKSLAKLDEFISEILMLSKNNRLDIEKNEVDFNQIVQQVVEEQKFSADEKNIEFKIEIEQKSVFISDAKRIKSIINNLISNSIRYCDKNKSKPFIHISIKLINNWAQIQIEDNGIGIENQYLNKVFNMFFRANDESKGSGLGLYIVKETLGKLKGNIKIESELSEGTKIYLTLPSL